MSRRAMVEQLKGVNSDDVLVISMSLLLLLVPVSILLFGGGAQ